MSTFTLFQCQVLTLTFSLRLPSAIQLVANTRCPWHFFREQVLMFSLVVNIETSKRSCIYLHSLKAFGLSAHPSTPPPCVRDEGDFQLHWVRDLVWLAHCSCLIPPELAIMLGPRRDSGTSCHITLEDKFALSNLDSVLMAVLKPQIRNACCRDMGSPISVALCPSLGGLPCGTSGKEPACKCRRHKRPGFDPWIGNIPWRKAWQPPPVFMPGKPHRQRSLAG